jgi:hypothetical protein
VFEDVTRDERFTVSFQIDIMEDGLRQITEWLPDTYMIGLARGYVDGELEKTDVIVLPRGVEG